MKKSIFLILSLSLFLLSSVAFASDRTYNITLAAAVQTDTAMYRAAEDFKNAVESKTGNKIQIELVFAGVLGGDREMIDAHTRGDIEMVYATDIGFATNVPEIGFANLPFLFPDYEAVDKYYFNGFIGEKVRAMLLAKGIHVLGWGENDYRSLTSNNPIKVLDDLKGMKIRVPEFPSLLAYFRELGANPTPMSFTEVLTGLQQRTIDGQDNGPILTQTSKFYEVQKHFTWTNHVYSGAAISANEEFFNSLPAEYQKILQEEGERIGWLQIKWNREQVADCVKIMEDSGIIVSHLTPELTQSFRDAAAKVWNEFKDQYDAEVMDYIFKELAN